MRSAPVETTLKLRVEARGGGAGAAAGASAAEDEDFCALLSPSVDLLLLSAEVPLLLVLQLFQNHLVVLLL